VKTCRRTSNQAALVAFLPKTFFVYAVDGRRVVGECAERTNAVSSCGLEMSAGSESGFGGLGEEPCDSTGVLEPPWSPFEETLVVTLSG